MLQGHAQLRAAGLRQGTPPEGASAGVPLCGPVRELPACWEGEWGGGLYGELER